MQEDSREVDVRDRIRLALAQADDWVSGEDLADRLGISRAAVGKHVARLRREGNYIQSSTRKGFRLRIPAERIDPEIVQTFLATSSLGRERWVCLDETTSTNSIAAAMALEGARPGAIVTAESQIGGKGRKGHAWFSSPRSLQFSLILRPGVKGDSSRLLTEAAQHALVQALRNLTGLKPVVKKPNDILLGGRKVAGILVEMGLRGGEVDWLVLGVGCNVNAVQEEFPPELAEKTTSVFSASNVFLSRNRLLAEFLTVLEENL